QILPGADLSQAVRAVAAGLPLGLRTELPLPEISPGVRGPEALFAIGTGEATLRELDRAGLLGRLAPELDACRTLMPEDSVHAFSVFEHSLRTVRNLDGFAPDSFCGRLREGLASPSALYLAALLHDVGKIDQARPHSEVGAEIAADIAIRWGLAKGVAGTVEWLVRHHLAMARFVGMRDVSDPKTVEEFAAIVGDRERLDMLTVLTCADVQAVAPGAWTPAQDAFLRELHGRTSALMESEIPVRDDPQLHRRRLLKHLKSHPIPDEEIESFLSRLPAQYAVGTPAEMVPLHMRWVSDAESGTPTVAWDHDRERRLSEVTVCAADAPGLLSRILGVLYAFDLSVHGLRANTTSGEPAVALDTVLVSFGHHPVPPSTCAMAARSLKEVLTGASALDQVLRSHGKDPDRNQNDFTYDFIPGSPGILEVRAPRGRGMAFRISKMIAAAGWNIVSARFGQWAGRGAAAFYVLGPSGPLDREDVERVLGAGQ
ncbi:MAG TPA: HD domain-containing protein, partial [Fimbriimonadaceae bacterium]|nr:HD domain-containing protein [Fimbriimonadaceae bacterium]